MHSKNTKPAHIRLATRGSKLALAQAHEAINTLTAQHSDLKIEIVKVKTSGDQETQRSLQELAGDGHFTRAIDQAVLEGRADFAVHSLKDLPVTPTAGMGIAAVLPRNSPVDSLLTPDGITLAALPQYAAVGSGSLRRGAQLLRLRPDIKLEPVRGNIDSRLTRLEAGEWDGLILAEAGLRRLGISCKRVLLEKEFLPAAGQGAVALAAARENDKVNNLLAGVNDQNTAFVTTAERAFLHGLGAGCHTAAGVRARIESAKLFMEGAVWSPDGVQEAQAQHEGSANAPAAAGIALAEKVISAGGMELLG